MRFLFAISILLNALTAAASGNKLKVVTSFSILADFACQIGGDAVEVVSIVPENSDPHVYQPTPDDIRKIAHADLVLVNGLGFEGWLERLVANAGGNAKIITVTSKVKPRTMLDPKRGEDVYDPHAWHDVTNALLYVESIEDAFTQARPENELLFKKQAKVYRQQLNQLDKWVKSQFKALPMKERVVVTTHDAFWYYGQAYQITFLSPVGISTDAESSAAAVSQLINEMRDKQVRAVFIENLSNRKLIEQIAEETQVSIDGTLYADSLSDPKAENSPAKTYIEMVRHNTLSIVKGLVS